MEFRQFWDVAVMTFNIGESALKRGIRHDKQRFAGVTEKESFELQLEST